MRHLRQCRCCLRFKREIVCSICARRRAEDCCTDTRARKPGIVIAADRHAHRLAAMRMQLKRLAAGKAHLVELDAEHPLPFQKQFHRILFDAPCWNQYACAASGNSLAAGVKSACGSHKHQASMLRMALFNLLPVES